MDSIQTQSAKRQAYEVLHFNSTMDSIQTLFPRGVFVKNENNFNSTMDSIQTETTFLVLSHLLLFQFHYGFNSNLDVSIIHSARVRKNVEQRLNETKDPTIAAILNRITKGNTTYKDMTTIGSMVHQYAESQLAKTTYNKLKAEVEKEKQLRMSITDKISKLLFKARDSTGQIDLSKLSVLEQMRYNRLQKKEDKAYAKLTDLEIKLSATVANTYLNVFNKVRDFGVPPKGIKWSKDTDQFVKGMVDIVAKYLPSDWWESSSKTELKGKLDKDRPHYDDIDHSLSLAYYKHKPVVSLYVTLHELAHRMEHMHPAIKKLERDYYHYRTANEPLIHLGENYATSEFTRKDRFADPYLGKDGALGIDITNIPESYELLTMYIGYIFFRHNEELGKDKETLHFILGMLSSI